MPWRRSLLLLAFCVASAPAADWPQWLGPNRDCSSSETVLPWKEPLQILWHKPVGDGHSSPVVAGGKVFLFTKVKDQDQEDISAYDAKTGEQLWHKDYDRASFFSLFGLGPQATPAVADGRVYTYGVTGVLACWNVEDGKERWRTDALKDLKAKLLYFGQAGSPLVDGGKVYIPGGGGEGPAAAAFTTDKGEVAWKKIDGPASYASPILIGKGQERRLVFLTGDSLTALDPESGDVAWQFPVKDDTGENSATPVLAGDLLIASTVKFGGVGVKVETKDGKAAASQAWKNPELTCYFSTPVAVGDQLYMVTGTFGLKGASSTLRCVETKTGHELWHKENVGKFHAALLRTGDDKLLMLDDYGNLSLIDPDPKEYKEMAKSKVCGATWAHPALSDGRVYLRDDKELICVQTPTK